MSKKINYYWRIVATGFCFSCFGLGGLLLALTVFPITRLLPIGLDKRISLNQAIIHYVFKFFVGLMRILGVVTLQIKGQERLLTTEGQLIIANHPSLIDVVVLISFLKQADCVVKQNLWKNPFLKGVVSSAGYISNDNPEDLINHCVQVLKNGRNLIIFPEGTRSNPEKPLKFLRGAANMAISTPINITPVIIKGTAGALGKNDQWYQVPKNHQYLMSLKVAKTINIKQFLSAEFNQKSIQIRRLNKYLQDYYKESLKYE